MVKSSDIVALHDGAPAPADTPLWQAIAQNHWHNCRLWEQEDLARRRHAPDSEIAGNKRAIDSHNQQRNDAIERIDGILLSSLPHPAAHARLSSETAGSMIDRLSIVSLKVKAMREQTQRTDVSREHVETCQAKLERLIEQRGDLAGCLDRLLEEAARGVSRFKVYRQFKMYNDPALNPAVYNERKA
jgi:hypothetical protein